MFVLDQLSAKLALDYSSFCHLSESTNYITAHFGGLPEKSLTEKYIKMAGACCGTETITQAVLLKATQMKLVDELGAEAWLTEQRSDHTLRIAIPIDEVDRRCGIDRKRLMSQLQSVKALLNLLVPTSCRRRVGWQYQVPSLFEFGLILNLENGGLDEDGQNDLLAMLHAVNSVVTKSLASGADLMSVCNSDACHFQFSIEDLPVVAVAICQQWGITVEDVHQLPLKSVYIDELCCMIGRSFTNKKKRAATVGSEVLFGDDLGELDGLPMEAGTVSDAELNDLLTCALKALDREQEIDLLGELLNAEGNIGNHSRGVIDAALALAQHYCDRLMWPQSMQYYRIAIMGLNAHVQYIDETQKPMLKQIFKQAEVVARAMEWAETDEMGAQMGAGLSQAYDLAARGQVDFCSPLGMKEAVQRLTQQAAPPASHDGHNKQGIDLYRGGKYMQALNHFQLALKTMPVQSPDKHFAQVMWSVSSCMLQLSNFDVAKLYVRKAIELTARAGKKVPSRYYARLKLCECSDSSRAVSPSERQLVGMFSQLGVGNMQASLPEEMQQAMAQSGASGGLPPCGIQ